MIVILCKINNEINIYELRKNYYQILDIGICKHEIRSFTVMETKFKFICKNLNNVVK
jgi:hypothetical protein